MNLAFSPNIIGVLLVTVDLFFLSYGAVDLSRISDSTVHAEIGTNVSLIWNYTVTNRKNEFDSSSPIWLFEKNGSESQIAFEDQFGTPEWKWTISSKCPPQFLKPKQRIYKEDVATLIITNVTLLDKGKYTCRLELVNGQKPSAFIQLNVVEPPTKPPPTTSATSPSGPKKIFSGSFKTNRTYVKEMADKNSQPYRNEADIVKIMFRDDVFKGKLASVNDITLISGSVIVIFNITLVNVSDPLAVFKAAVDNSGGTLSGMTIDPNSIKEGQYIPPSKTTAATPTTPSGEGDGLGAGEIAGIVIAVVLVVVVIVVIAVWFWKKSKNNHGDIGACNTEMEKKPAGNGSSPDA